MNAICLPSGDQRGLPFTAIAERELHLAAAVDVDAIDVSEATVGFPVGLVDRKEELPAVR